MTITERTLKKWRREALVALEEIDGEIYRDGKGLGPGMIRGLSERVLRMTQVLLDQHLLRKEVR